MPNAATLMSEYAPERRRAPGESDVRGIPDWFVDGRVYLCLADPALRLAKRADPRRRDAAGCWRWY